MFSGKAVSREQAARRQLSLNSLPPTRKFPERRLVGGPFVQSSWIEIRPVGPHKSIGVRINSYLVEQFEIA